VGSVEFELSEVVSRAVTPAAVTDLSSTPGFDYYSLYHHSEFDLPFASSGCGPRH
jgi:hypothetical protein